MRERSPYWTQKDITWLEKFAAYVHISSINTNGISVSSCFLKIALKTEKEALAYRKQKKKKKKKNNPKTTLLGTSSFAVC